jgi:glucosamine--fructose-6-phosphate aminotransferase (isomerizing)
MAARPGHDTYREIRSQGEVWAATLAYVASQADALRGWLAGPWTEVVVTGCGSSYYLALTLAAVWQSLTGVRARAVPSSELWLFPDQVLPRSPALLIACSRSGETTETLRGLEVFQRSGRNQALALTCRANSSLAAAAAHRLVAQGAVEESVVMTRSFTSMLLLGIAAAALAAGPDTLFEQLDALPPLAGDLLTTNGALARRLGRDATIERFVFLGSGVNYGLACEAMLKTQEMALTASQAFHVLEFRHGPKAIVGSDLLVVGLVSEAARAHEAAVLAEMQALSARVLVLAASPGELPADWRVPLPAGLGDLARAPLMLPALQLLAYERAVHRGLDPDHPARLQPVVRL